MNKDIWHTADIKPKSLKTFVYETDKGHIGTSMLTIDSGWNPVLLPEFYSMDDFKIAERIIKWCYLDDLLALERENKDLSDKIGKLETELERTRKALDKAKNGLKELKDIIACPPDVSYETCVSMYADGVLQEITALEQKDVK